MNRYETPMPRMSFGLAAIALSVVTLGLTVMLPASLELEGTAATRRWLRQTGAGGDRSRDRPVADRRHRRMRAEHGLRAGTPRRAGDRPVELSAFHHHSAIAPSPRTSGCHGPDAIASGPSFLALRDVLEQGALARQLEPRSREPRLK